MVTLKTKLLGGLGILAASGLGLYFFLGEGISPGEVNSDSTSSTGSDVNKLVGAGASFPAPLYQTWFIDMKKTTGVTVDYQSVGSGAGVRQYTAGTVDFGASDVAMKDSEIEAVDGEVLMLPMTGGSVVMAFNLDGLTELRLSRETYVDIFLGNITNWNDAAIASDNPGVNLPDREITVVHRSDGSGTTGVFTKHLAAISEDWAEQVGEGKSVSWPTQKGSFIGAKGNEGVTAMVSQTPGAIGYVEYGYAKLNNLNTAVLENRDGEFVAASGESSAAGLAGVTLPENLRAFAVDPEGADSYPIVSYSWLLVKPSTHPEFDPAKAVAMEKVIEYGLTTGQEKSDSLGYVPLPDSVRERVAEAADQLTQDYSITLE